MSNHTVAFFPSDTVDVLGHKYVFGPSQISFSPKVSLSLAKNSGVTRKTVQTRAVRPLPFTPFQHFSCSHDLIW